MFDYKQLLLKEIIEKSYEQGVELTPELISSGLYETSSSELAELLCIYINGLNKIAKKEDLKKICLLEQDVLTKDKLIELLQRRNNALNTESIKTLKKLMNLKCKLQELELKNQELVSKLQIKDRQLANYGVMTNLNNE